MTTHALAGIIADARRNGTLTSTPVNNAIRAWLIPQDDLHARRSVVTLHRMIIAAETNREMEGKA